MLFSSSDSAKKPRQNKPSERLRTIPHRRIQWYSTIALFTFVLLAALFKSTLITPLATLYLDAQHRANPRQVERLPVLIVDIDEAALKRYGQWPWPRWRIAELIEKTMALNPLAIGLDMIFAEPDQLSAEILSENPFIDSTLLQEIGTLPDNDRILADTIQRHPIVVGRAGLYQPSASENNPLSVSAILMSGDGTSHQTPSYDYVLSNLPILELAASGYGVLNALLDKDGVVRRAPLLLSLDNSLHASLAIEVLRTALGVNQIVVDIQKNEIQGIKLDEVYFSTDGDGSIKPHFSLPYKQRRVSAAKVLDNKLDAGFASGQMILIGATASGIGDIAPTVVASAMDGVEIQAQVIENLVKNSRLLQPRWIKWLEYGLAILCGLVLIFVFPKLGIIGTPILLLLLAAGNVFASHMAFREAHLLLDPIFPIICASLVFFCLLLSYWQATERSRRVLDAALKEEELRQAKLAGELSAARKIQMGILPNTDQIAGLPTHLSIYAFLQEATQVGGDYYDAFMLDETRLFFAIADVSGKGVPAALFMAIGKSLGKSAALRDHQSVDQIIRATNHEISRDNTEQLFITALFGILDSASGKLYYCNAGHDAPIILSKDGRIEQLVSKSGPPLCILEDFDYPINQYQLQTGDKILTFTDGVTEAMRGDEDMYGMDGLSRTLNGLSAEPTPELIVRRILEDVELFYGAAEVSDDITLLAMGWVMPENIGPNKTLS